ncbi:MAG: Mrp/NBP35 family ATP-binding protein [Anaerolineae bacterium]|nr:Mrp/NBP35 family ATP-binding protein [Candidatus Roseilinea sp.]MDW8448468.1 Mrp/NBP35 family ATP-binding protein [Anaerolineae bacterium]
MGLSPAQVLQQLSAVNDPELRRDLVSLGMIRDLRVDGGDVRFTVRLTTPACPLRNQIERDCRAALGTLPGVRRVEIAFDADVSRDDRLAALGIRNLIVVASGKGGVGKTTCAVNLAVALAQRGARVGLLDADIYGPNVPLMLGLQDERPGVRQGRMQPLERYRLRVMSMGFLLRSDQPVIWRGPMLHKALEQLIMDTAWGELDYLFVDLPPGTGDVSLSLAQIAPISGAVIVTTPQDVALADVQKGIAAFRQMNVPVLGVIENMSYFVCDCCGKRHDLFSHGGGRRMAERLGVACLGEVPLHPVVREGGDAGAPVVAAQPDNPAAAAFVAIAGALAAAISVLNFNRRTPSFIPLADIPTT